MNNENIDPLNEDGEEHPLPWVKRARTVSPPSPLTERNVHLSAHSNPTSPRTQNQSLLVQTIRSVNFQNRKLLKFMMCLHF